jgi:hypothetical protein
LTPFGLRLDLKALAPRSAASMSRLSESVTLDGYNRPAIATRMQPAPLGERAS